MSGGSSDITETQLDGLRKIARSYRAGEIICIEGEPTRDLMFLMQGAVEVLQGESVVKMVRGQQVFLGQISFFASQRRTATLRAKTRCEIVRIREERIEGLLAAMPSLAIRLIRDVTEMFVQKEAEVKRYREYGSHAHNAMRAQELVGVVETYLPLMITSMLVELPAVTRLKLAMNLIDATSSHIQFSDLIMNKLELPRELKRDNHQPAFQDAMQALLREKSVSRQSEAIPEESVAALDVARSRLTAVHETVGKLTEQRLTVGAENELRNLKNRLPELEIALEERQVGTALDSVILCVEHVEKMSSFAALQRSTEAFGRITDTLSAIIQDIRARIDAVAAVDREGTIRRQILDHLRFEI